MNNEENLIMSPKERERSRILSKVKNKEMTLKQASQLIGISYRQTRTLYKKYLEKGEAGLVHKHRGKSSNRATNNELKVAILERYFERYHDFGPTLASEKLLKDGYEVTPITLWRWLIETGSWTKRTMRKVHRSRRKSRSHFGEMVQLDGSDHEWFEERNQRCVLMNLVDDATGKTFGLLFQKESTESAMQVLWEWIKKYGIPLSLYTDRHSIYYSSKNEKVTQFGRACQELGVKIIYARSPQAKGKIEKKMLFIKIALSKSYA